MRSGCGAFESDGSSTTCYLYLAPKKISGTNGYPGVKCFTSVAVAERVFEYFGPGGCSTETAKYPGKDVTLKNTNEADCSKACASKPGCGAFERDGGSTTCYLFVAPKTISGTNGYPGVKCFKKPDKRETAYFGKGGCSTSTAKYPSKDVTLKNTGEEACGKACAMRSGCGAFESDGSSTTCYLYLAPKKISGTNGYPGVKCFTSVAVAESVKVAVADTDKLDTDAESVKVAVADTDKVDTDKV